MSLDEKNRCALDINKKHLWTLEHLDSTVIGTNLHSIYNKTSIIHLVISSL